MSIIITSLIAAALLIVVSKLPVAIAMAKQKGGYDNRYPRDQQSALTGFGKRALSAHLNSIEAFPLFAAGVCIALIGEAQISMTQNLCVIFICARIAYLACYWLDIDKLRSLVWTVGFAASLGLMFIALP